MNLANKAASSPELLNPASEPIVQTIGQNTGLQPGAVFEIHIKDPGNATAAAAPTGSSTGGSKKRKTRNNKKSKKTNKKRKSKGKKASRRRK